MSDWYVMDADGAVRGPVSVEEWSAWRDTGRDSNRVARTDLDGGVFVSTVFLGLDHSHWPGDPPILFETMIFEGPWNEYQWRWATADRAKRGHEAIVAALRAGTDPTEAVPE